MAEKVDQDVREMVDSLIEDDSAPCRGFFPLTESRTIREQGVWTGLPIATPYPENTTP